MGKNGIIKTAAIITVVTIFLFSSCTQKNNNTDALQAKVDSLQTELKKFKDGQELTEKRLIRFDSLDFNIYSGQHWKDLSISHEENIKVYYPDGHTTNNLTSHIDELKPMFVFAPDTKIRTHPVKFGSGDWTAVIGETEGTFSAPMPTGNGKSIPPTNKKFKLSMVTIGHWKNGKMTEEYLFWDNASLMKQIGLAN